MLTINGSNVGVHVTRRRQLWDEESGGCGGE